MKVKVNFEELSKSVNFANTVLNDKSVEEKSKNIIFRFTNSEHLIIGYSQIVFSRNTLEDIEVIEDLPEDGWSFQIKASELNKIINSFSGLYKTKVDSICFYNEGVRIGIELHEYPINEEDTSLERDIHFCLESTPIPTKIMNEIKMEFPEDTMGIPSGDLMLYTDSLFPLMSNDSSSSMAGKMNFTDNYVFVMTSYMSSFMVNKLPDAMKDMVLTYSSISFLKKISEGSEDIIELAKKDNTYLCVRSNNTEAFMKFQRVKINSKMHIDKKSEAMNLGVVVNRLYLKDVLRRMGNMSSDGILTITDEGLQVENPHFSQIIPVNKTKGDILNIKLKISVPTFEKAILGKDDIFSGDIFIYFVKSARGYLVYFSDGTGAWFADTQMVNA